MGFDLHIGAHVEYKRVAVQLGQDGGERRPVHTTDHSKGRFCSNPGGSCVSCGHHGRCIAAANKLRTHRKRRVAFPSKDRQRRILHPDHIGGVNQLESAGHRPETSELSTQSFDGTDQTDGQTIVRHGVQRPLDADLGRVVATHGIECDGSGGHHSPIRLCVSPFTPWSIEVFDLDDFATLVASAVRTDLVRRFGFEARRAKAEARRHESVVGASFVATRPRNFSLWIRHQSSPFRLIGSGPDHLGVSLAVVDSSWIVRA